MTCKRNLQEHETLYRKSICFWNVTFLASKHWRKRNAKHQEFINDYHQYFLYERFSTGIEESCKRMQKFSSGRMKFSEFGIFVYLIHFGPMLHFYTARKRQKISGFLTFSRGIEMENWVEMGYEKTCLTNKQCLEFEGRKGKTHLGIAITFIWGL